MDKDEMIKKMAIDLVDEIDYSTGIYGDSVEEYAVVYFDYDHTAKNMVEKGYRKVADDEMVVKKSEYAELCMAEYEAIDEAIEYEKRLINLKKAEQEAVREFATIIISITFEDEKDEKMKIRDFHDTMRDVLRMHFGIELEDKDNDDK